MTDIPTYQEYEDLFKDDLVVAVRKALKQQENFKEVDFGPFIHYFNKFGLHKKLTKAEFTTWK